MRAAGAGHRRHVRRSVRVAGLAEAYVACVAGASTEAEYLEELQAAGFVDIGYTRTSASSLFLTENADPMVQAAVALVGAERLEGLADTVWSYKITARKP